MSNKQENENLSPEEKDRQKRYKNSMLKAHINAYISRALNAGIPDRYLRIGPDQFKELLCPNYHGEDGVNQITHFVYKQPFDLLKIPFIVIDGGDTKSRKLAAFAIMFRLITCDKFAKFYDCTTVIHKLNTFDARDVTSGERRIDFANTLKQYNVLCLSEFHDKVFKEKLEGGDFLDEILDERFNKLSPTIITFQKPINKENKLEDLICGKYLNEMSSKDKLKNNPSEDYLRIRVRAI